jgi:ATP-dependent helicase HrpA
MVHERVSLYGLPIVPKRRVGFERTDPAGARELFIRHGLVQGEWSAPHAFLQANHDRVVEVLALEHRVRRDLIVDDDALVAFFEQRLPAEVTTGRRFDQWWRDERSAHPDLLTYTMDVLVDPQAGVLDEKAFPEWVEVRGTHLALTYVSEPGAELDGVSVDVPVLLLDAVDAARLDWLVPGMRSELVTALVRALPKDQRRRVGTAGDTAAAVLRNVGPADGPLLDVVGAELSRLAGQSVRWPAGVLDQLPAHLRVTYRAVDDAGRPVAWSKDLAALRARMAQRQRAALAASSPISEVPGLTGWTVGEIPRRVEASHAGTRVVGYPTLVDEGDSVALRVLPTEPEQRVAMWGGTRRLLLLQLGSPLRTLDSALSKAAKRSIATSPRISAADVYRECAAAAVDELMLATGGPVWDGTAFDALLTSVRGGFARAAVAAAEQVGSVLSSAAAVESRLSSMTAPAFDETVVDVQQHLDRLLRPGWITLAGSDRLADVARYLRALEHRLVKAVEQPDRDRSRLAALRSLERDYRSVAASDVDGSVRTMLEELRVATFAQPVGAKGGPSEQKVRKALASL